MKHASNTPLMLVTGGSRGVGAATVRLAAKGGYDVAFSYASIVQAKVAPIRKTSHACRTLVSGVLAVMLLLSCTATLRADAYDASPKLVIILVFDQFRGDYLDRYRADFHAKNGWNLFLKQGAHFTDCYYDYANLVTAAGHSTIGTASYTNGHGVPINEWWEPGPDGKQRLVTSVQDDRYRLVGGPESSPTSPGASPHNELASTLGDELTLATGGRAKVFGVSFKDRAAILTSGHASRGAFWTDHDSGAWQTSTYWMQHLPDWAVSFNAGGRAAQARKEAHVPSGSFYEGVGRTPASVSYQLDFARALINGEHLGRNPEGVTDLLTLSISSTDILGHNVGPDSTLQRAMIDAADAQLDAFFTWLDGYVGLKNVMVGFTGDHGVAPLSATASALGIPARAISSKAMLAYVEQALQTQFKPRTKVKFVLGAEFPWLQIDPAPFLAQGVGETDAEKATAAAVRAWVAEQNRPTAASVPSDHRLPEPIHLQFVYTASQLRSGDVPNTPAGRRELNSYSDRVGWAVHLNFGAYQFAGTDTGATHYSGNAYDRHVPLDLYGAAFTPGTYHDAVQPVDIAATFASLLRINQPSASVGHVLTEVMLPEQRGTAKQQ